MSRESVAAALASAPARAFLASCGVDGGGAALPCTFAHRWDMELCTQLCGALASPFAPCTLDRRELRSSRHAWPRLEPVLWRRRAGKHPCVRLGALSFPAPHDPPRASSSVVQEVDLGNMFACGTQHEGQMLREAWAVAALLAVAERGAAASVVVHVGCWLAMPPPCEYYGADDSIEDDATVDRCAAEQEAVIRAVAAGLGHDGASVERVVLHVTLCAGRFTTGGHATRQVGIVLDRCFSVQDVVLVLHVGCNQHGGAAPELRAEVDGVLSLLARHVGGRRRESARELRYLGLHFVRPGPRNDLRLLGKVDLSLVDCWDLEPLLSALASSEVCPALTVEYHVDGCDGRYVNRMLPHSRIWLRWTGTGEDAAAADDDHEGAEGAACASGPTGAADAAGAAGPTVCDAPAGECVVGCENEGVAAEAGRRALCLLSARLRSVRLVGVHASEIACLVESAALCNPHGLNINYNKNEMRAVVGMNAAYVGAAAAECALVRFSSLRVIPSGVGARAPVVSPRGCWPDVLLRTGAASATGVVCGISVLTHLEDRLAGRMSSVTRLTLLADHCASFSREAKAVLCQMRNVQYLCLCASYGANITKIPDLVSCFPSLSALVVRVGDTYNYPYAPEAKMRGGDAHACLCGVADAIALHGALVSVKVQGVSCSGISLRKIAGALEVNTRLRHLQIDKCACQISSYDVKKLGGALRKNSGSQLRTLTLGTLVMHTADVVEELARCLAGSHVLWSIRVPQYQRMSHLGVEEYFRMVAARIRRMLADIARDRAATYRDRCSWAVVRAQIEREKDSAAERGALPRGLGAFTYVPLRARRVISSFVSPANVARALVLEPFA